MMKNNNCYLCGCEINSDKNNLCEDCQEKNDLSIILKNLLDIIKDKLNFKPQDLIKAGANKDTVGDIVWKLIKLNLIKSYNKKLFINDKMLINEFINKYLVDSNSHEETPINQVDINNSYEKDILNILDGIVIVKSPKIPFPQANDLNQLILIGSNLMDENLTKSSIKQLIGHHERIVDIYISSGLYLGIFEKYHLDDEIFYKLSIKGKSLFKLDDYNRNIGICHCILEHEIFYIIFNRCLENNEIRSDLIIEIMNQYDLKLNSDVTIKRRSSCVSSWMHWIFKLMYPNENFK